MYLYSTLQSQWLTKVLNIIIIKGGKKYNQSETNTHQIVALIAKHPQTKEKCRCPFDEVFQWRRLTVSLISKRKLGGRLPAADEQ